MYKYSHGGAIRFTNPDVIDFSANINPLGLQKEVANAIISAIDNCTVYPDPFSFALREKIAEYQKTSVDNIICTNGASDLIFRLAFAIKPKKALVLSPTFSDYEKALTAVDCHIYHHFLLSENNFMLDDSILDVIKNEDFNLIYICNPNNPTGCITNKELLIKIIDLCNQKNCYVAVDECFLDFLDNEKQLSVKNLVNIKDNLIIIKAFTKIFALAGVRLGYGICANKKLMEKLYSVSPDWSVSNIAQSAGISALENSKEYIKDTIQYIQSEKQRLVSCLMDTGFTVYGSQSNYIFFKSNGFENLQQILLEKYNIFIRSCSNYYGLDNSYYRIGISTKENNQKLIKALQNINNYGG